MQRPQGTEGRRRRHDAGPGGRCTGQGGDDAEAQRNGHGRTTGALDFVGAHHVAAAKVAGFVGDDAEQLVRRIGLHDQAGIEADREMEGGKGVEIVACDQQVVNLGRVEPGGVKDRRRLGLEEGFDFGIADDVLRIARIVLREGRRVHKRQRRQGEGAAGQNPGHGFGAGKQCNDVHDASDP